MASSTGSPAARGSVVGSFRYLVLRGMLYQAIEVFTKSGVRTPTTSHTSLLRQIFCFCDIFLRDLASIILLCSTRFEHAEHDHYKEEVECLLCCPIMPALSAMQVAS